MLKLKDGVSLDHEAEATIDVTVTATDSGGLSTSESFTLQVADINEGPVAIGLDGTTLDENAEGAKIGTLATKDPDAGDAHSYTVSDDRFEVVDGTLKLKDGIALDHEAEPTVDVTVTATDSGGLATSETFTLSVTDVNEGPVAIGWTARRWTRTQRARRSAASPRKTPTPAIRTAIPSQTTASKSSMAR